MVVDWIKHAFIAKFNKISASTYKDYSRILRCDIFDGHKGKMTLDHSYAITKRLGMSQIPLACVFFRFIMIAYSSSGLPAVVAQLSYGQITMVALGIWVVLIVIKILYGMCLIYYVGDKNNRERKKEMERRKSEAKKEETEKRMIERNRSIESLSNIEKYTMLKGVVET
jgi:Na+-transporting methylmalonyl-CoA/oxaloacetate decarboxylase gamma subunit